MSVLYIALPIAIALGALAMIACVVSIRTGQFDDLETPPLRILLEDKSQETKHIESDETNEIMGRHRGPT